MGGGRPARAQAAVGVVALTDARALTRRVLEEIAGAPDRSVPTLRSVRRRLSAEIGGWSADAVLTLADALLAEGDHVPRWLVYELVHHHEAAMATLDGAALERLGEGMAAWGEVDPFATYLSGVAWREGLVPDSVIHAWARREDRWWRRAALVSTVALNTKARGGEGDAVRTLAVCDLLKADRDDMVVKALSWALRALAVRDPEEVRAYLEREGDALAPRVRREVRSKLETGLKSSGGADPPTHRQ